METPNPNKYNFLTRQQSHPKLRSYWLRLGLGPNVRYDFIFRAEAARVSTSGDIGLCRNTSTF